MKRHGWFDYFLVMLIAIIILFIGIRAEANDIINNKLPELKKDVRGYKLPPLVVYNKSNGKYETVYLNADSNGVLTVTTSTSAPLNVIISSGTSAIISVDERFANDVSTHTGGKLNNSGAIPDTNFEVYNWAFYSDGGDSSVTGAGGTIYALNGLGNNSPILHLPFLSPTFTATLPANTTFYYDVWGSTQ